ncbi:MAG: hypothetical protein HZA49_08175 [Planctomycetes bacterium]|nr:hypothetical protein [Planctomycetota bacterium]
MQIRNLIGSDSGLESSSERFISARPDHAVVLAGTGMSLHSPWFYGEPGESATPLGRTDTLLSSKKRDFRAFTHNSPARPLAFLAGIRAYLPLQYL